MNYRNDGTVLLSGGIGGARMARGFAGVVDPERLTIVVNIGDDQEMYGVHVAADIDTVTYTLAGIEGPHGWGIRDDAFTVMEHLATLGVDTSFRIGDRDLATCLLRTSLLRKSAPLSEVTARIAGDLGIAIRIVPASDDRVATRVRTKDGEWLDFQDYFVVRGHRDDVAEVAFEGHESAVPAPGVVEAIAQAARIVIAPSNPPLSIWPILAVPGVREAVEAAPLVIAVSPLIGGKALKGPAADVMASLGLPDGNAGVLAAYPGLLSHLVVHETDADDVGRLGAGPEIVATNTLIGERDAAEALARELLEIA